MCNCCKIKLTPYEGRYYNIHIRKAYEKEDTQVIICEDCYNNLVKMYLSRKLKYDEVNK